MTPEPVAAVVVRLSHGLMPNLFRAGQRTSLSIQVGEIGIGYGLEYPRCICQSWLAPIFRDSPSFPATTGIHADMLKTDRPLEHLSLLLCTIPAQFGHNIHMRLPLCMGWIVVSFPACISDPRYNS